MAKIILLLCLLGCCMISSALASHCYSDICHNKSVEIDDSGPQCLLTSIQRGKDCVNLRFENMGLTPLVGESLGKFRLSAYVKDFGEFRGKTTAFNLSMSDVKFYRLIMRYQDSGDDRQAACREIEIYGKEDHISFPEIFVSCPFAEETFEAIPYRLEYLAVGKKFEYSRKLVFVVPRHMSIDKDINDVRRYTLFFYVDVSNVATVSLHIQPMPEEYNVTRYKVWLINNDTNSVTSIELTRNTDEEEIQKNFSVVEGVYYFKVAAMHPNCDDNGCVNSTSPVISTKQPTRRLLIMIISVVWIPPVILYAMYYAYQLCVRNCSAKEPERRTNCLLVYSPTHTAHVDVMKQLAIYMRSCSINAMIDILDIPKTTHKDPGLWCNSAFRDADVIVVVTSPPPSHVVPIIYRNVDNHALRLLKENYPRRNKRYFAVQFPYCKHDDLPEEARLFRRFNMPQELEKLVRNIYAVDRVRFFGVSSREFGEAVKFAMFSIPREKPHRPKKYVESCSVAEATLSEVLLDSERSHVGANLKSANNQESKKMQEDVEVRRYFTTKIDELNLLGDNGETDTFIDRQINNDEEFRIERLNL